MIVQHTLKQKRSAEPPVLATSAPCLPLTFYDTGTHFPGLSCSSPRLVQTVLYIHSVSCVTSMHDKCHRMTCLKAPQLRPISAG